MVAVSQPHFNFVSRVDIPNPSASPHTCFAPTCGGSSALNSLQNVVVFLVAGEHQTEDGAPAVGAECRGRSTAAYLLAAPLRAPDKVLFTLTPPRTHCWHLHQDTQPFSAKVFPSQMAANTPCPMGLFFPPRRTSCFPHWNLWGSCQLQAEHFWNLSYVSLKHTNEFLGLISSAQFFRTHSTHHWVAVGDDKHQAPHIDVFLALMCSVMWFKVWKMLAERWVYFYIFIFNIYISLDND